MKGLVLKSTGKWYDVLGEDGKNYTCQIRGKLRLKGAVTTNPVAAGDHVDFTLENDETGNITGIDERKNYIIRKSVNLSKEAQIVASNIDLAFLVVTTTRPQTTPGFIDRFLVTAEAYGVDVVIVFNKIDQYEEKEQDAVVDLIETYSSIGYTCLATSTITMQGLDALREMMKDKVCLLSGHSGTGKSSIVNLLIPGKDLRIGDISESSNKGQHTTTFAEMHDLDMGGQIIDTPGIKTLAFNHFEVMDVAHNFREMFALSKDCKFADCTHRNEPNCAVKNALKEGWISEHRYQNYLNLVAEVEDQNYWERHNHM